MRSLFDGHALGSLELPNRIVMAPMTRARCPDTVPGDTTAEYYRQRASAGLIVTEGVPISPQAQGYALVPGIWSQDQVDGWRTTTDAVHAAGGRVFAQLWHVGRLSHTSLQPEGRAPVSPSATVATGVQTYVHLEDGTVGFAPVSAPRPLSTEEVGQVVSDFGKAARHADLAGFDGVELHAANGYLVEQFLNPATNDRSDRYGGSTTGRIQFLLDVVDGLAAALGPQRVGVRLSPFSSLFDMAPYPEARQTYLTIARELALRELAYVHLVDQTGVATPSLERDFLDDFRRAHPGTIVLAGGMTTEHATTLVSEGVIDLAAFGQPYIANPDLVDRMRHGWPLTAPDPTTFYGGDSTGYTDYPRHLDTASAT